MNLARLDRLRTRIREADETPLQPRMVISIEPGVCIPGAGGALWADNYVVTRAGVDPLTAYPIEVT